MRRSLAITAALGGLIVASAAYAASSPTSASLTIIDAAGITFTRAIDIEAALSNQSSPISIRVNGGADQSLTLDKADIRVRNNPQTIRLGTNGTIHVEIDNTEPDAPIRKVIAVYN